MTRHGSSCPRMCSQCAADVVVRRVEQDGDTLTIDGVAVRPIAPAVVWSHQTQAQRAKGGALSHRNRKGKSP